MIRTETAHIALADEVIVVRIDAEIAQSPDQARANLQAAIMLSGDALRPILVDISRCLPLTQASREVFSGEALSAFCAIAMLIDASPLGRMMGNAYLRIAQPSPRSRLFTNEPDAIKWLRERAAEAAGMRLRPSVR